MKFINTLVINIIKRDLVHARKSYFIPLPQLSYIYWLIYFKYEQMNLNLWIWFISKGLIYANESSLAKDWFMLYEMFNKNLSTYFLSKKLIHVK